MKDELSLYEFFSNFPDEESSRLHFEKQRWEGSTKCPHCGSHAVSECKNHKPMPYRCKDCRKHFSVRTGTVLEDSRLSLHKWLLCIYVMSTSRKGVSSIQMGKHLGCTQKTAWYLMQRIRETWENGADKLKGEVEVDETFIGGKEKNKHNSKRRDWGRGGTGKDIVVGAKSREGKVISKHIPDTGRKTLHEFIHANVAKDSIVYTDTWKSYKGLEGYTHESVNHSVKEYVREKAHTNGIESFWALLKRGYYGIYHYMSSKHLHRYVSEFSYRYNTRTMGTLELIDTSIVKMVGKHLPYRKLIHG